MLHSVIEQATAYQQLYLTNKWQDIKQVVSLHLVTLSTRCSRIFQDLEKI